jgi:hypothetical protein
MKQHTLLIIAALSVSAACAQAQTPGDSPAPADRQAARAAIAKACDADIKSYCSDQHGRELMMCLRTNADKLSAGCKDAMASMRRTAPPPPAQ